MKYCRKCGKSYENGFFCTSCGSQLEENKTYDIFGDDIDITENKKINVVVEKEDFNYSIMPRDEHDKIFKRRMEILSFLTISFALIPFLGTVGNFLIFFTNIDLYRKKEIKLGRVIFTCITAIIGISYTITYFYLLLFT